MPNSERIETLISPEALKQFEALKASTDANTASFEKLIAKAVELNKTLGNASSYKEINKATRELEENDNALIIAHDRLKKSSKDLGDSFANVGAKINAQLGGSTEDAIGKLLKLNEALKANKKAQQELQSQKDTFSKMNQDLPEVAAGIAEITKRQRELKAEELLLKKNVVDTNKEIRQRLNLSSVESGTREEIKSTIKSLKELRDQTVKIDTDEGQAKVAELNEEIDKLNKILEQTGDKLEKRKINIGNYQGAAHLIIEALEKARQKVETLGKAADTTPAALSRARSEFEALRRITGDKQFLNFSGKMGDATAEVRTFTRTLVNLETQGLGNSEVANDLRNRLAELTDQISDTKAEVKALSSDTRSFDLFASSVSFAADVFQTAAGAAVAFGASEEEAAEATKTLLAIQTVANGVKGIANELTTRGTAANKLYTFAQNQVAIAMDTTAAASARLKAALITVGIGAIIIGIGLLVANFGKIKKLIQDNNREQSLANQIQAEASKEYAKSVSQLEILRGKISNTSLSMKERNVALNAYNKEASKANQIDASQINNIKHVNEQIDKQISLLKQRAIATAAQNKLTESAEKLFAAQLDFENKFPDLGDKTITTFINNATNAINEKIGVAKDKINIDEFFAFADLPTDVIQRAAIGNQNLSALLDDRTRNIVLNSKKQIDNIRAYRDGVKFYGDGASLSFKQITDAQKEFDETLKFIQGNISAIDLFGTGDITKQDFDDRLLKRQEDQFKKLSENDDAYLSTRLSARQRAFEIESQITATHYAVEIANANGNSEAIKSINKKYAIDRILAEQQLGEDIIDIRQSFKAQQREQEERDRALFEDNPDAEINALKKSLDRRVAFLSQGRDIELTILENKRAKGLISEEEYQKERLKVENSYAALLIQAEIEYTEGVLQLAKLRGQDTASAEAQLAALKLKLSQTTNAQIIADNLLTHEKEKELLEQKKQMYKDLGLQILDVFNAVITGGYERQIAAIQAEIEKLEEQKNKEVEVATATIVNKEERELAIAKIEAKAQAQKETLEKRQQAIELQKAKFEKAAALMNVAIDTAQKVAAIKAQAAVLAANPVTAALAPLALSMVPLVITAGALAAGLIAAKPLPKFADGTEDAPGGLAWVGDAYKKELVITPQGQVMQTPSVPTVMNVPKHSIVLPDARTVLESGLAVNNHGRLVQRETNNQRIEQKLDHIAKVIKNKPVLNMNTDQGGLTAMWQFGANWVSYADDQIRF